MRLSRTRWQVKLVAAIAFAAMLASIVISVTAGTAPLPSHTVRTGTAADLAPDGSVPDQTVAVSGVRLDLPDGWRSLRSGDQTAIITNGVATAYLATVPASGETLAEAAAAALSALGVQDAAPEDGDLAGEPAQGYRFADSDGEHELWVALSGGMVVLWVGTAPAEEWAEQAPQLASVRSRISVRQIPDATGDAPTPDAAPAPEPDIAAEPASAADQAENAGGGAE